MMMLLLLLLMMMILVVMMMTMRAGALDEISFASFPTRLHPSNLTFGLRRASNMTPTDHPRLIADDDADGDGDDGN